MAETKRPVNPAVYTTRDSSRPGRQDQDEDILSFTAS